MQNFVEAHIDWVRWGSQFCPSGAKHRDAHNTSVPDSIRIYEMLVEQPVAANSGAVWWKLALLYQDAARFNEAGAARIQMPYGC